MNDVLGQAQTDYYHHRPEKLWLYVRFNRGFDGRTIIRDIDDSVVDCPKGEVPIGIFFREEEEMPAMERKALELCRGRILDVGAGAGCHSLPLQTRGQDATALDYSPLSAALMTERGVNKVICEDFYALQEGDFDTLLLMWNGIGMTGTIAGFRKFLAKARNLLRPGGQIIFDSTDCAYIFQEKPSLDAPYYGESRSQYEYKDQLGGWFGWLFIDRETLRKIAAEEGWEIEIMAEGKIGEWLGQYLVRCIPC